VNALADPKVGKYLDENFVSSFQKVATFKIVGKNKQGGNVASYFCAPDGRVLHVIPGPVDAATLLREAQWVVETARKGIEASKGDGGTFKAYVRKAHADKVRSDEGLTVEPVTFDPPEKQGPNDALTYNDPTGRPLAPVLPPVPIDGPDVKFHLAQEANARQLAAGAGGISLAKDRAGRGWAVSNVGRAHLLLAGHGMGQIERLYGSVFEGILGERISTRPVEIVHPFPWYQRANLGGAAVRN